MKLETDKSYQPNKAEPGPVIKKMTDIWFDAEKELSKVVAAMDSGEPGHDQVFNQLERQEKELVQKQMQVVQAMCLTPSTNLAEIAAKLKIWKETLIGQNDDLSHCTATERLGIIAVRELTHLLDSGV